MPSCDPVRTFKARRTVDRAYYTAADRRAVRALRIPFFAALPYRARQRAGLEPLGYLAFNCHGCIVWRLQIRYERLDIVHEAFLSDTLRDKNHV